MITFIEKEPFGAEIVPGRQQRYFPIYMVKDGKEYFVRNRMEGDDDADIKEYKKMLMSNNGQYFRLHGYCKNPFDLITDMKKRRHRFTEPKKVFRKYCGEGIVNEYTDFHGNMVEVSAAFQYRIYDEEMVSRLKAELEKGKAK